jgi:hypothetical protein
MEFLLGTFEREWERRRAAILRELQMGQLSQLDWDLPRRGGVARLPDEGLGGTRRQRRRDGGRPSFRGSSGPGRSMRSRFAALARGSQPAVVKVASYGRGVRVAAMMSYASRNGGLAVENEKGERVSGKAALAELRCEWEHLFDNRAASRDIGMFYVTIDGASVTDDQDQDEVVREILRAGFDHRRFLYAVEKGGGELDVRGVLVLRDPDGERLTGDIKASAIIQQRFDKSDIGKDVDASFRFHGHGNGVEFGTARVRELVQCNRGGVRDETGRQIETLGQAGDLVRNEWRRELHSRKGRDVMHLVVSARAGTDAVAFHGAVRDFLGTQFAGHRYMFSMHDPSDDPKEMRDGGKRPHIHAHAIVTMRSETGERLETSPRVFREWRALMAEKAREHGIDMELTDRRDLASPPAYTRHQVRPVSYAGRTEHEGTSEAGQARYDAKRSNQRQAARSERSTKYVSKAAHAWREIARDDRETAIADFAANQVERTRMASRQSQIDIEKNDKRPAATNLSVNMVTLRELIGGEEAPMRAMTRPEFEAYEKRVEAVLANVETSIEPSEWKNFEEVVAAARDVVNIRREYLEFTELQADADVRQPMRVASEDQRDRAVARHGQDAVELGNDMMVEIEAGRQSIDRAIKAGRDPANARSDLERGVDRAARLALAGNTWLQEVTETDRDLRTAIETIERLDRQNRTRDDRSTELEAAETAEAIASKDDAFAQRPSDGAAAGVGTEAEQIHNNTRHEESDRDTEREQTAQDDQSVPEGETRVSRDGDGVGRQAKPANSDATHSDPPQQHAPRLGELERGIEERHDRERDDHER